MCCCFRGQRLLATVEPKLADCNVPVQISVWLCWLFVLGEDGKTRRLLDAFVTDIHSGGRIWESNSKLALFGKFYKNAPSQPTFAFLLNGLFRFSLWTCIKSTAKENAFWRWLRTRINTGWFYSKIMRLFFFQVMEVMTLISFIKHTRR